MTREPIYAALFAKFASIGALKTKSRRWRHWTDVAPADSPALFQAQKNEEIVQVTGQPPKHVLHVNLWVCISVDQTSDAVPSTAANPVLDAIETALAPDPVTQRQTLGGLCYHCKIAGSVDTDEGLLGTMAVFIVPIEIQVP